MNQFLESMSPMFVQAIMAIFTALLGYFAVRFQQWTGIKIEEKYKGDLHDAIKSAVEAAMQAGLSGEGVFSAVRAHLTKSVPDAMKSLNPPDSVITTLTKAKINEVTENQPPAPTFLQR